MKEFWSVVCDRLLLFLSHEFQTMIFTIRKWEEVGPLSCFRRNSLLIQVGLIVEAGVGKTFGSKNGVNHLVTWQIWTFLMELQQCITQEKAREMRSRAGSLDWEKGLPEDQEPLSPESSKCMCEFEI